MLDVGDTQLTLAASKNGIHEASLTADRRVNTTVNYRSATTATADRQPTL